MRAASLLIFILICTCGVAQSDSTSLIGIHPAVGKSISQSEKIQYSLFPEYKDNMFESAQIFRSNDSTYLLQVRAISGASIEKPIGTKEMDELYHQINAKNKSKQHTSEAYVKTNEERAEERRKRSRDASSDFWWNFLAQMTIITFETLIVFAFAN